MVEVLSETYPRARKDYPCMASRALFEGYVYPNYFTPEEISILFEAHNNGSMIKKGDVYLNQRNKMDDIYTFRARPEVLPIYFKYGCDEC